MRAPFTAIVVFLLGFSGAGAWAQEGGVAGTVLDPSGSVLSGARVEVSGPEGVRVVRTTDDAGRFEVAGLAPGRYEVRVEAEGFTSARREVEVAGTLLDLPFTLSMVSLGETVVVSASKAESTLINAPATLSVISGEQLELLPAQGFGEVLRAVPGVNVVQTSARDVQLTTRTSAGTLASSELALLDGRSLYLDFFGFVMWDLVPTNPDEIKQIEVVRGPASVVWGANALTGVVNIITKSPREAEGIRLDLSLGRQNRDAGSRRGQGDGSAYGGSFSLSRAPNDRFSYRVSAGYFHSDPYSRPIGVATLRDPLTGATFPCPGAPETGCVPLGTHPLDPTIVTGGAPYPIDGPGPRGLAFRNSATDQPRFEVRVDQDLAGGGRISYSGGYSGTSGIMHTGIGPFDIQKGSYMGFGRVAYRKGAFHVAGYSNFFDVDAPNLLLEDPLTGDPVELSFKTQTYDLEVGDSRVLGGNQILTYGGNLRRNDFEITLTPNAKNRTELGLYLEDEIYWDRVRLSLGVRVDKFGNIDDPVFSPRLSAMFKPTPDHSLRVSMNRAFRAPSAVHNYLEQDIYAPGVDPIDLTPLLGLCSVGGLPPDLCPLVPTEPVPVIVRNAGNPDLKQESVTAFEVAYTGTVAGRTTLGLSWFQNDTDDSLNFVNITPSPSHPEGLPGFDVYTPEVPPPGIPGPLYGFLQEQGILDPIPRTVTTYLNLGPIRQRGLELSIDHRVSRGVWASANYSFQGTPKVLKADPDQITYPTEEVGVAPRHRFNAEVRFDTDRLFGSATFNYTGWAFWQDVLTLPYHGRTNAFTLLNASLGVRLADGRLSALVRGTNLANKTIQQHIFGDILKRSVFLELRLNLD